MSVTARLADFALSLKLDSIDEPTRVLACQAILDVLACAIAGREERVTRVVRGMVLDQGSTGMGTLWGSGERVSPGSAALVNGTAAHALDFDDVSWAMQGHPSVPLVPAAIAVAECRKASGADLLAAYVAGFEVQCRLGQALTRSHYEKGWHPTATLGVIGATTAVGRLLGLDPEQLRAAYGIACSRASGSRMAFGTDTKPLHAGLAARAGLEAAEFARRGLTAVDDGFEADMGLADLYGGDRTLELPTLGRPYALLDPGLELKPYPACRFTHRTIDAVLALRERNPDEIVASIECRIDPFARKILIHPRPTSGLEAKFSLPYCTALAWLDGWPELRSFSDERSQGDDVQDLLARVTVNDSLDGEDSVEIIFESGRRDQESVEHARGSPQRPLDEEERLRKVRSCTSLTLGGERTELLIASIEGLDALPDVTTLGVLCSPVGE